MTETKQRKRRRPGEGGVNRRPNGTFAAVIELAPDTDGKRRRKFAYAKTEREALAALGKMRRQLEETGDLPTADMPLGKWMTYWLENIAFKRVKPGTFVSYRSAVVHYINPSIGKRPLSRLSLAHVRQMHDYTRSLGCNSTTARKAHRVLAAALNDAVREGRVGRNIASLVPAPAKAVSTRGPLSYAEAVDMLKIAARSEETAARWLAAFLLGARQGELLGLRWDHVDLDAGLIDLAWSLQVINYAHGCGGGCGKTAKGCPQRWLPIPDGFEFERLEENRNLCLLRPKTRTSRRVVPLADALWAALRLHRENAAPNPHGLVWAREDGRPISPKEDWTAWTDLLKAAGIKRKVTLHEARHSTATWLAEEAVAENVIVNLLGHSDVIVNRSYQHLSPATGREALNLLGAKLALPNAAGKASVAVPVGGSG